MMRDVGTEGAEFAPVISARIGSYVRAGLDSADHGRNILFNAYGVLAAKQNGRAAALPRLDHQNLVEVYQNLFRGRPRSFQRDKNSHLAPR
jgi:hypothetical protein